MAPGFSDLTKQQENYLEKGNITETKGLKIEAAHTQKSNSSTSQVKTDSKFTLYNKKSTLTIEQNYKFSNQISTKLKLDPSKYTIETTVNIFNKNYPNLGVCNLKTSKHHNNGSVFNIVASHKCLKNKLTTTADFNGNILTGKLNLTDGKVCYDCKDIGINLVHKVGKNSEETKNNLQVSAVINQNIGANNFIFGAKLYPNNLKKTEAAGVFSTFKKQESKVPGKFIDKLNTRAVVKTDFQDKHTISIFNQTDQHLSVMTGLQYSLAKKHSLASIAIVNTGKQGLNQHFRINSDGKVGYSHSLNVKQFKSHVKSCKVTIGGETCIKNGNLEMPKLGLGLKFTI